MATYAQPYDICIDVVDDVVIGTMHIYKDGKPYAHTGDIIPEDIIHEEEVERVISLLDKLNKNLRRSLRIFFKANNENELLKQLDD